MTIKEYKAMLAANSKTNKYGAKRSGGYASVKEHRRACELKMKQRAGLITDLREQVRYVLIPAQQGERSCSYVADFVYVDVDSGQTVVEDTKGIRTKDYIIKRKLMLWIHGIRIKEV